MPDSIKLLTTFAVLSICTALVQNNAFFWDTVQLGSKHAHFFYENGLQWAPLPTAIDSGHPPVFGYYLALVWTFAGKTLPASHWAMLPFLLGIAGLLLRLGQRLGSARWAWWLLLLAFADPVLAGQSTLVGPDLPLVFFFLLSLEGIWSRAPGWVVLGILGLCAISMRGMMTASGLFAWQLIAAWRPGLLYKPAGQWWMAYIPGFSFAAGFLAWHWIHTGWIGFHPGSPWAASFQTVGWAGLLKNILILGWRWTDAGRIVEWSVFAYLVWMNRAALKQKLRLEKPLTSVLLLFCCVFVFLSASALIYRNLNAHRYFLPAYLGFHLLVFHLLSTASIPGIQKRILAGCLCFGLATGNLWIYPRGISMDWDSTLAYLPYHGLRAEMIRYLDEQQIDFSTVGSSFPNVNTGEHLLLNGDKRQFSDKDFSHNTFIFASNIFNDFSEADYEILERDWKLEKKIEHLGVWITLYRRQK